jgi:molybdate/tungstate transport system permease protein
MKEGQVGEHLLFLFDTYGWILVIIAYHPMVAPVLIYDRFTAYGLSYSAPVAAVMIAVSVMVFLSIRIWNNRVRRG